MMMHTPAALERGPAGAGGPCPCRPWQPAARMRRVTVTEVYVCFSAAHTGGAGKCQCAAGPGADKRPSVPARVRPGPGSRSLCSMYHIDLFESSST